MNLDCPHVMIDLETMGTGARAAIASIGAVYFSPSGAVDERTLYVNVDLRDAQRMGMEMDGPTVYWWLKQSAEARAALVDPAPVPLAQALQDLAFFMRCFPVSPLGVWSHGASFDLPIIREAFTMAGRLPPWTHREEFCYRTIKMLMSERVTMPDQPAEQKHNALDDARYQASCLSAMLRHLYGGSRA